MTSATLAVGRPDLAYFRRRIGADDALLTPEVSLDLESWLSGVFTLLSEIPRGDGTALVTMRAPIGSSVPRAFVRLRIAPRQ